MCKLQRGLSEGQKYSWRRQLFYFDNDADKMQKETSGLSAHTKAASLSQLLVLLKGFSLTVALGTVHSCRIHASEYTLIKPPWLDRNACERLLTVANNL